MERKGSWLEKEKERGKERGKEREREREKLVFFCFIIARVEKEREKKKERVGCSFSFFYPLNVTFEMFFSAFLKGGRGEREGESERGGGVGRERAFFLVFRCLRFFLALYKQNQTVVEDLSLVSQYSVFQESRQTTQNQRVEMGEKEVGSGERERAGERAKKNIFMILRSLSRSRTVFPFFSFDLEKEALFSFCSFIRLLRSQHFRRFIPSAEECKRRAAREKSSEKHSLPSSCWDRRRTRARAARPRRRRRPSS